MNICVVLVISRRGTLASSLFLSSALGRGKPEEREEVHGNLPCIDKR